MTKPFVFTLMPFDPSFDDIYKLGIKVTCEEKGAYCERVDEQIFQGSILDRILNQISKADVIIGDMTGRNPNVFFEVGYAKALDKKIILLTSSVEDIPFDLKHYAHVVYDGSIVKLKEKLQTHLLHYLDNLDKSSSEVLFDLSFSVFGIKLIAGETTKVEVPKNWRMTPLTVENISGKTLEKNSVQLTAQGNDNWLFTDHENKKYIINSDKKEVVALYNELPIFPGSAQTYRLCHVGTYQIELCAFTNNGSQKFMIEIIPIEQETKR